MPAVDRPSSRQNPLARTATSTGAGTTPATRPAPSRNPSPWSIHLTTANNREEGKHDQEEGSTRPAPEGAPNDNPSPTSTLTDAENDWLSDNVIPWLSYNNVTLNEDGSYHSNSTIPPLVQQWLNLATYRHLTQEDYATGFRHLQTTSVGPPHVDHTAFSPRKNEVMREEGLQIVGNRIYAPQGFNKYLLWLRNHAIPWLSNNDIALNDNGSYHSDSTIPPLVQQWLNLATYRHLAQEDYATGFRYLQTTSVGPPHVDHPAFSPRENKVMQEEGLQTVGEHIYAPQGVNAYLKKFWEKKLAKGELYREPTPPPTSSDDSDSTPPKRSQKKPALARKKTPIQRTPTNCEPTPSIRTLSASAEFTGPPPNTTPAEINQWVALWFRYHPTRTTPEGIVQCLAPGHTTPPWVQTWVNNARQVAEANTPDINTGEDQPAPPAAAAAHTAPPQDEIDDAIEAAASAWLSSNVIHINGKFHCVDPDQVVPQYVHDWMDHIRAQIGTMKQENHPAS